MQSGKITQLKMPGICPFDFQIKYTETNQKIHFHEIDIHTHDEFELYINLSGDISFLVENTLYPVSRGDVIIARPGVQHHCIYRSEKPHKLFWILFDCKKNQAILDFLQQDFRENFISPRDDLREELLSLCEKLHSQTLSKEEQLYSFFRFFAILRESRNEQPFTGSSLPQDLTEIISYINRHICEELSVAEIAKHFYLSQSTLERRFKQTLKITPLAFIRKKKLFLATQMLRSGESVIKTSLNLGYNDISYFIELFKRNYHCTPHEYKLANTKSK